jgi:serine/threonine protein phosphatase 1
MNGGVATLASDGVPFSHGGNRMDRLEDARAAFAKALPPEHFSFLDGLHCLWRSGDCVFVHAGVRPGVPLGDQDPEDIVWIRDEFLEPSANFGAIIVNGHTIRDFLEERAHRIGIDAGAFATRCLTCLCLDGEKRDFMQTQQFVL